jgi:hypothetical protein
MQEKTKQGSKVALLGSSLTEKNSILFSATTKLCITVTKAVRPFNGPLTVSPALSAYVDEELSLGTSRDLTLIAYVIVKILC